MRKQKGLTQDGLARRSGVSKSMISAIENEERHPTVPILCGLARALQVRPQDLYEYD
ncbi:helix-turn-helix transcriptional regulator [Azotosporobacter soli]|uniref:helix-turn-helix transcriptional regulator n=1 Tax=Azotosporobacter soli TaxID=3055040 RepID=UPI0031FF12E5